MCVPVVAGLPKRLKSMFFEIFLNSAGPNNVHIFLDFRALCRGDALHPNTIVAVQTYQNKE